MEDAVCNENANVKYQKTKNENLYKMAISVFQNFGFLTPKFFNFFLKMDPKIQNIQNFQKTVTYVIQLLVVYQCTKFQVDSSIFDPQMECFCLRNHIHL